jgi:hypothetical protein
MRKIEKVFKVKNLRTGETFTTSTVYEKDIDGDLFIGVWQESDPHRRINWIRRASTERVK